MATYENNLSAGNVDTNAFDVNLLASLLRSAPQGAELSFDGLTMDYNFSVLDSFSFLALDGFSAPWTGTINAIVSFSSGELISIGEGFSADGAAVQAAIANGDADGLNALFWGGNDRMVGGASNDTLRGFAGRDALLGGAGTDTLIGDGGNDRLVGGSGEDLLFGGDGNDRLFGCSGNDVLVGGAGKDVINGGFGGDIMTGGSGADTFEFASIREVGVNAGDEIRDFSHADGDKIDLHLIDAVSTTDGDQAFTFVDGTVTKLAADAAGIVVVNATDTAGLYAVQLQTGSASALFFVTSLDGALTADDFIL